MLVLKNVSVVRGSRRVLSGVNLRIEPGELVCVTGKSGSGKSTVFSLFAGILEPTSGAVEIDGMDLKKVPKKAMQLYRRRLGVIFEDGKLLPLRSVGENVAFPLEVVGAPPAYLDKRVRETLKDVGLLSKINELPERLTSDERVRVGIARAVIHRPLILLADEPLALLDDEESAHAKALLKEIHKSGSTVIIFTHNASLAQELGARIVELDGGTIAEKASSSTVIKKHEIFEDQAAAPVASSVPPVKSQPEVAIEQSAGDADKTPGRKIRVTSIHSD